MIPHPLRRRAPVPALLALIGLLAGCATEGPSKHGPRYSPGSELVRKMTFAPLQFAVPRVGQAIERHVLSNGIVLYLAEDRSLPVVDGYAVFRAGSLYEDHSRPGVAQLAASQLRNGGTATLPAESLNEELETLGASLEASASGEAISLRLGALAKDADRALQLLAGDSPAGL